METKQKTSGTSYNKLSQTEKNEIITQFEKAKANLKYNLDKYRFKKTTSGSWIITNPFEVEL